MPNLQGEQEADQKQGLPTLPLPAVLGDVAADQTFVPDLPRARETALSDGGLTDAARIYVNSLVASHNNALPSGTGSLQH